MRSPATNSSTNGWCRFGSNARALICGVAAGVMFVDLEHAVAVGVVELATFSSVG